MKIYENFLELDVFEKIQSSILNQYFPWYYDEVVVSPDLDNSNLKDYQLIHNIYEKNVGVFSPNAMDIIRPLINKINPFCLLRVKANLNLYSGKNVYEHGMHTDFNIDNVPITTAIFYINNNNGYTKFETNEKIYSVENRFIEFNSNIYHSGSTTTNAKSRVVINLNYIK